MLFAPGSFTQPFLEIGDAVPADERLLTGFGHQVQLQLAPRVGMHGLDGSYRYEQGSVYPEELPWI